MLVRKYQADPGHLHVLFADLAEYCDAVGFNFIGLASTARMIADHRTKE
jgi:hypothetical protein